MSQVQMEGETYFRISNSDAMRPFFMSIVSDSNHWMFISSNGGLTAGRKNAEYALFPYYTDDKITESAEITGSKALFWVRRGKEALLWEPFSERGEGRYRVSRNLYKNAYGNKVLFEEINHDLGLAFRYQWCSSDAYGFVRQSTLINNTAQEINITVLDGIQNLLPYGVPSDLQMRSSNLVDAYKKSELEKDTGLGIYALSAIIVDKAEPSEALKANIAWSLGLENPQYLLSSLQLKDFRKGLPIREEVDVRGEKGAYFIHTEISLAPRAEKQWMIIADVNKNHSAVARIMDSIKRERQLGQMVKEDIEQGTRRLAGLAAAADGLQQTADAYRDARHFSNTLFNIMRGGIFDQNYQIEKQDFSNYLAKANKRAFEAAKGLLEGLPALFSLTELRQLADKSNDAHFRRLALEYMPLKFSRRHGDPSRPWNKFSINTRSEVDGAKILDYEGNWRDIFQNWEALAHSYPGFIESMIHKFLNATTFDGYNPYRVTKDGFDWETIEPDDPWSYIGYWGDHQIIYLLKFLEFLEDYAPGKLATYFDEAIFVFANVPYRIKPFEDLLKNPKDTIEFDHEADQQIREKRARLGADGALLQDRNGAIHQANFIEKILATLLAKLSNFIPEGGIWMNTQRPEWNDANNALVGNGVSMVTLYYLRRFLHFFEARFAASGLQEVTASSELVDFFNGVKKALEQHQHLLAGKIDDKGRKQVLAGVGQAGSDYRSKIYEHGFSGGRQPIKLQSLRDFVSLCLRYLEHTIAANKRPDNLYHAYNLLAVENEEEISLSHLSEMLEGQVAVLSSGYLSSKEALQLLDALKNSKLFRDDQYSYILYPDKELPRFTGKNNFPEASVAASPLLQRLVENGNTDIIERDINGAYHFNGNFKNANDLRQALEALSQTEYAPLVAAEKKKVLEIFEKIFNHKAFTGRSGTFFGYEGLGSIYWHMVSKLLLAVQECCLKAIEEQESEEVAGRLLEHYYEINEGIGVHKPPSLYGAFPTDPYSHTPAGKGAQQPGMTGQVKEDILSRFGELGVFIRDGRLCFDPCLLRKEEFAEQPEAFDYVDVHSEKQRIPLEKGSLCFTFCQVPIIYKLAEQKGIEVIHNNQASTRFESLELDVPISSQIFARAGEVLRITVQVSADRLR
ncbi:MAG: hypothetical protein H6556_04010 [Lewinellaceae bacterium]|nr:hypothetical protein [Lewinellaceae bacterium]